VTTVAAVAVKPMLLDCAGAETASEMDVTSSTP
jgi:hypothetical protein